MKKLVLVLALLCVGLNVKAENGYTTVSNAALQSQHDWDHLGVSYAIQTIDYGLAKRAFGMDDFHAKLFSFFVTTLITTMYSVVETAPNAPFPTHDLLINGLGAGLSIGTCMVFDF